MKKFTTTKLSLNKIKISRIQNSSHILGASLADPAEASASASHDVAQSQDHRISCFQTQCATLGAGEVTVDDPMNNTNVVVTNNSQ